MKKRYLDCSEAELKALLSEATAEHEAFKALELSLDMSRGKPCKDQLSLSMGLLDKVTSHDNPIAEGNIDCRNYGGPDGIPEAKRLFAQILGCEEEKVIIGGSSSLNMMFDFIAQAMISGLGEEPWCKQGEIKFLCPSPGYDRHFAICEHFGIKMIPVAMDTDGPDIEEIERLVKDPSVKGMWCVPKYSNPQGITYSDDMVRRIANLKPAAKDFRIMWDNAYSIHLVSADDHLIDILAECKKAGNPSLVVEFASTAKVTFAGGGIACVAANKVNRELIRKRMSVQTICNDKINQLRHARMFPDFKSLESHMRHHAEILEPKFRMVLDMLNDRLGGLDILAWNHPNGGYFISVDTLPGCAKRVVELCKEAGVVLTSAGATYPYGNDPLDSNIRIAPSFPPVDELRQAMKIFTTAVKIATCEMLIEQGV
ncbi:MAG: aminotransferase class I/II-fold pyridoxal phosphate-dependent enzyme [Clostridia bacterium]|nr:aminotransferase class I/II-fold pyridoxal phosphate-dependent enzyme [Clostridia bacterium]